jgi:hypothetical protein
LGEVPNDGIVLPGRLAAVASSFRPHCGFFFQGIRMFLSFALQLFKGSQKSMGRILVFPFLEASNLKDEFLCVMDFIMTRF